MSTIYIKPGDLVTKDPAEILVYGFDWNTENLATGVTITISTWSITAISPSTTDALLTKDQESSPTTRTTQARFSAGTLGQMYEIANKVLTNESPTQTKERSFRVLLENK